MKVPGQRLRDKNHYPHNLSVNKAPIKNEALNQDSLDSAFIATNLISSRSHNKDSKIAEE